MMQQSQQIFMVQNIQSTVKFGTQLKNLGFLYTNTFGDSLQFKIETKPKERNYAKLKYSPSEKFILEPGIRINLYNVYSDSIFPIYVLV